MSDDPPITQRILDAAEAVLRRHGVEKANVVDIAKSLGMSHANIYRHFPSKRALIEAVAVRHMHQFAEPMRPIVADRGAPAADRLVAWFDAFRAAKREKCTHDPELFRVYYESVAGAQDAVSDHVGELVGQIASILRDGIDARDFRVDLDVASTARAFLLATAAFHHPAIVRHPPGPTEADAKAVMTLLLAGLRNERRLPSRARRTSRAK